MNKVLLVIVLLFLPVNCSRHTKNELLIEAYGNNDYVKCIKILESGADGRIDYLRPNCPLLFDICQQYVISRTKPPKVEELFYFYLKNRKAAFEDSISGAYKKQTVGSYLVRYASIELLQQIVQEKININSPDERNSDSYIFELARIERGSPLWSNIFTDLVMYSDEKKERMLLLLDAGADVALIDEKRGTSIFHSFSWYPMEEDYTGLLDRMMENGANLFQRDVNGYSCIKYNVQIFALDQNIEAYLEYIIGRGLKVMDEDLAAFERSWLAHMNSEAITKTERSRLEKTKTLLENNVLF